MARDSVDRFHPGKQAGSREYFLRHCRHRRGSSRGLTTRVVPCRFPGPDWRGDRIFQLRTGDEQLFVRGVRDRNRGSGVHRDRERLRRRRSCRLSRQPLSRNRPGGSGFCVRWPRPTWRLAGTAWQPVFGRGPRGAQAVRLQQFSVGKPVSEFPPPGITGPEGGGSFNQWHLDWCLA